jgi:hemolysin activation/secretion protein
MRYCILILLLFIFLPASAQNVAASQSTSKAQGPLISSIKMEGFVLGDKNQFVELFKPYRNKHLSTADIDTILQQLQEIYEQAGYQELVSIVYRVKRKSLVFTVSLIK